MAQLMHHSSEPDGRAFFAACRHRILAKPQATKENYCSRLPVVVSNRERGRTVMRQHAPGLARSPLITFNA